MSPEQKRSMAGTAPTIGFTRTFDAGPVHCSVRMTFTRRSGEALRGCCAVPGTAFRAIHRWGSAKIVAALPAQPSFAALGIASPQKVGENAGGCFDQGRDGDPPKECEPKPLARPNRNTRREQLHRLKDRKSANEDSREPRRVSTGPQVTVYGTPESTHSPSES